MESESSLSSLSSEEDVLPKKKKTTAVTASSYKLRNILRPPHTCTYSADTLYQWIHLGDIELEPEYQRDVVWPDIKQTKLIDSLLRNFYVPPIIFRVTEQDLNGHEKRICIDGKQRLTSLHRFMDGLIPHCDNDTRKKYYFKAATGGPKRTILPEALIKQLKQKQIVCIEYRDLPDQYEREIFQRVQMGMPLLPAERMAAISGPWAEFATSLKNEYLAHDDDAKCLADHIDTTRSRDFLAMAQVLIAIHSAPDRVQFHAATVEKWLQRVDPPPPAFKARVRGVMDKFRELVSSEEHSEIFIKHRLAPVEFVMVAFLIAEQKDASLPELAEFIAEFRNSVRKAHADVRSNNKVIKTCYDVIEGQRRGAGAFSENRKRKKRAEEEDEEEDEDYRGTPVTKISKPANTRSRNVTNHSPTKKSSAAQSPAKSSAKTHHPPPTAQMQNTSITSPRPTTSSSVPSPAMSPRTQPVASTSKSKLDGIVKLRAHKLKQNLAQGVNAHPSNSGVNGSKPQPQASVAPQGISGGVNEFFAAQPPQTPQQASQSGSTQTLRSETPPRLIHPQNGVPLFQRPPQAQNQTQGSYFGNAGTLQDSSYYPKPAHQG